MITVAAEGVGNPAGQAVGIPQLGQDLHTARESVEPIGDPRRRVAPDQRARGRIDDHPDDGTGRHSLSVSGVCSQTVSAEAAMQPRAAPRADAFELTARTVIERTKPSAT